MENLVIYNNGEIELKVSVENDTLWLSQKQLAQLFEVSVPNINIHIKSIYKEQELSQERTIKKNLIVQNEGGRNIKRNVDHYNLDMIISIGYRVNSKTATKFRQWATSILKNYITTGYAINSHKITESRLSNLENDVKNIKDKIQNNELEIKQGIFFNGQIFDAYVFVSDLITSATKSIVLIDNYIDTDILTLFTKNQNVNIIIYTQKITKKLELDIKKYRSQYNHLEVKTTKNFHDRFLIIDDKIYHFGASLKDLGKKVFAFSKLSITAEIIINEL